MAKRARVQIFPRFCVPPREREFSRLRFARVFTSIFEGARRVPFFFRFSIIFSLICSLFISGFPVNSAGFIRGKMAFVFRPFFDEQVLYDERSLVRGIDQSVRGSVTESDGGESVIESDGGESVIKRDGGENVIEENGGGELSRDVELSYDASLTQGTERENWKDASKSGAGELGVVRHPRVVDESREEKNWYEFVGGNGVVQRDIQQKDILEKVREKLQLPVGWEIVLVTEKVSHESNESPGESNESAGEEVNRGANRKLPVSDEGGEDLELVPRAQTLRKGAGQESERGSEEDKNETVSYRWNRRSSPTGPRFLLPDVSDENDLYGDLVGKQALLNYRFRLSAGGFDIGGSSFLSHVGARTRADFRLALRNSRSYFVVGRFAEQLPFGIQADGLGLDSQFLNGDSGKGVLFVGRTYIPVYEVFRHLLYEGAGIYNGLSLGGIYEMANKRFFAHARGKNLVFGGRFALFKGERNDIAVGIGLGHTRQGTHPLFQGEFSHKRGNTYVELSALRGTTPGFNQGTSGERFRLLTRLRGYNLGLGVERTAVARHYRLVSSGGIFSRGFVFDPALDPFGSFGADVAEQFNGALLSDNSSYTSYVQSDQSYLTINANVSRPLGKRFSLSYFFSRFSGESRTSSLTPLLFLTPHKSLIELNTRQTGGWTHRVGLFGNGFGLRFEGAFSLTRGSELDLSVIEGRVSRDVRLGGGILFFDAFGNYVRTRSASGSPSTSRIYFLETETVGMPFGAPRVDPPRASFDFRGQPSFQSSFTSLTSDRLLAGASLLYNRGKTIFQAQVTGSDLSFYGERGFDLLRVGAGYSLVPKIFRLSFSLNLRRRSAESKTTYADIPADLVNVGVVLGRIVPSQADVRIFLDSAAVTMTKADGTFKFDSVPVGTHTVSLDSSSLPVGLTPTEGWTRTVTIKKGETLRLVFNLRRVINFRARFVDEDGTPLVGTRFCVGRRCSFADEFGFVTLDLPEEVDGVQGVRTAQITLLPTTLPNGLPFDGGKYRIEFDPNKRHCFVFKRKQF